MSREPSSSVEVRSEGLLPLREGFAADLDSADFRWDRRRLDVDNFSDDWDIAYLDGSLTKNSGESIILRDYGRGTYSDCRDTVIEGYREFRDAWPPYGEFCVWTSDRRLAYLRILPNKGGADAILMRVVVWDPKRP
jgi:hypothetical protein